ncbi:hypothetical protein ABPG74_001752 [Tetrahymena malaccensis]
MKKLTVNSQVNKHSTLLYGLAFLVVLLGILYAQFSYILRDKDKYNNYSQVKNKSSNEESVQTTQIESQENHIESKDNIQSLENNKEQIQEDQDDGDYSEDLDFICFEIFNQKLKTNFKILIAEVGSDIQNKLKEKAIKRQEIIKQYEILSKQNLDFEEIKQKFQQMENIFNNHDEESDVSFEEKNQQRNEKNKNKQQHDEKINEKDSYLNKLPKQILQKIICFIQHYDEHQNILSFDVLKYSEFIENEYYLIKWENKSTFYDLIKHLHSLLSLQEQFIWQNINQEVQEVNQTLIYFAKLLLIDLFSLYKESPNLFQYIDPYEQELIDIKNSLPMNQVIKNLVDQWEDNWLQMDIQYSSHLQVKREEKRQAQFEQVMQTTSFSNDRLKQQASQQSQRQEKPIDIEDSLISSEHSKNQQGNTQHQQEGIKSYQKQLKLDQNNNQQYKYNDNIKDQQPDLNKNSQQYQPQQSNKKEQNRNTQLEIDDVFNEEINSQFDINEQLVSFDIEETKKILKTQKRLDIKKITELYSEEDSDEITTLDEKIQELWNSKEWKRSFYDLEYNNYFLAKKKSSIFTN